MNKLVVLFLIITTVLPPLIAGISKSSELWSLLSVCLNTIAVFSPIASIYISILYTKRLDYFIALGTIIRAVFTLTLSVSACVSAWVYYFIITNLKLYTLNVILTSFSSILNIIGLYIAMGILHPNVDEYSEECEMTSTISRSSTED